MLLWHGCAGAGMAARGPQTTCCSLLLPWNSEIVVVIVVLFASAPVCRLAMNVEGGTTEHARPLQAEEGR